MRPEVQFGPTSSSLDLNLSIALHGTMSSSIPRLTTAQDIPLQIVSSSSSSERRVNPSWSIAELKTRLEPITGVPASSQRLGLRVGSQPEMAIEARDEDAVTLASFGLQPYAVLEVGPNLS